MADIEFLPPPQIDAAPVESKSYEVRALTDDEAKVLEPIFTKQGVEIPKAPYATIIGAIENGKVTENFIVVQYRVHAEPMNLVDSNLIHRLVGAAEDYIARRIGTCPVFVFAPAGKVARLAQQAGGMAVEPWVVMSKWVNAIVEEPQLTMDFGDSNSDEGWIQ